ncbi:phosphotransferase family protein [Mycobacterium riyadhense]|uniref:Aminoglycoside phosphotransferase n=1 Tax=Mycobacterium riyadhense TaxID=486698 RepID=A0A1X2C6W1_9MYCO|nr:aminoglycoside phosphotransferase family protein [Mycobacterium riyadhense]MCV7144558.1 aminoglycoside phosphotransferase family protein [Mycobacterium riyadhense]ORW71593.1 aminoglycoside phosphotransferase [Mycobacterium riyadhense]VTO98557.1 Phosphotransferase enzyme family protein [Mycobacterium riyadhense]
MIPRYPGDVTPEWLSAVLSERGTPVEVSQADVDAIGTGQTGSTYRVTAKYRTNPGGLPPTFVIKLPSQDDTVRGRVAIGYRSECAFYTYMVDRVQVPTPQCFYSGIAEDAMDFALLLADQAPAVQGDQIAGCGEREARLAVTALAGLHGPGWCDPFWLDLPEIAFQRPDEASARGLGEVARMSADVTLDKLGDRLSPDDRETVSATMGLVAPWLLAERDRFALLHGDYRLDNLLFDPDLAWVSVVDWQTIGVGLPARDLAYFTATSLNSELRAAIEEDLVDAYYQALSGYGINDYDRETCWRDYRLGMPHVVLISALGFAFAAGTERGDDMVVTMLRRGCRAIRDLETLELIG